MSRLKCSGLFYSSISFECLHLAPFPLPSAIWIKPLFWFSTKGHWVCGTGWHRIKSNCKGWGSLFPQRLTTGAGFGEHGCQAHLYLNKSAWLFTAKCTSLCLSGSLPSFGSLFRNPWDTKISQQKNQQYFQHRQNNVYAFNWFAEVDKLFQKTLGLRQIASIVLLNDKSLEHLQANGKACDRKCLHTLGIVKHTLTIWCALTSANTVSNYYYH